MNYTGEIEIEDGVVGMDFVTIGLALRTATEHTKTDMSQVRPAEHGQWLIDAISAYPDSDFDVSDTEADCQPENGRHLLNDIAHRHGFDTQFPNPFAELEYGVIAVVDKEMKWYPDTAEETRQYTGQRDKLVVAVKFQIYGYGGDMYLVHEREPEMPVVRIAADPSKSNGVQNYLWATELSYIPATFSELYNITHDATQSALSGDNVIYKYESVTLPSIETVQYKRTLHEVIGTYIGPDDQITAANQALRVSIDEHGATAAAVTSFHMVGAAAPPENPRIKLKLGFSGPLLVWFTEGNSTVPICAMIITHGAYTTE